LAEAATGSFDLSPLTVLEQTCKSSEMSAARFMSKLRKRSQILSGGEIKVSFRPICEIKIRGKMWNWKEDY